LFSYLGALDCTWIVERSVVLHYRAALDCLGKTTPDFIYNEIIIDYCLEPESSVLKIYFSWRG